jgi:hypothetical protein
MNSTYTRVAVMEAVDEEINNGGGERMLDERQWFVYCCCSKFYMREGLFKYFPL